MLASLYYSNPEFVSAVLLADCNPKHWEVARVLAALPADMLAGFINDSIAYYKMHRDDKGERTLLGVKLRNSLMKYDLDISHLGITIWYVWRVSPE